MKTSTVHRGISYERVKDEEDGTHPEILSQSRDAGRFERPHSTGSYFLLFLFALIFIAIGYLIAFTVIRVHPSQIFIPSVVEQDDATNPYFQVPLSKKCGPLEVRREWRTLALVEKQNYLKAAKCLTKTPSKLFDNGSLHDDFTWTHVKYAHQSHNLAPFLPFHRRFIRAYEISLRTECGYEGTLPYWDWSLDWQRLSGAPVWSNVDGFGGNGTGAAIGRGSRTGLCVADGPFANLQLMFRNEKYEPHCLSRAINDDYDSTGMRPDHLEIILAQPDYATFVPHLESQLHDTLPKTVHGDFIIFSAPNDPLFYLHHSQLDRLWWLWQQKDFPHRLQDYSRLENSTSEASLSDVISLGTLEKDVLVKDIMHTGEEPFCYRY